MGVKFTTTQITKTTSVAGGTGEFWTELGTEMLTKLHQLGMPIDIDQIIIQDGFIEAPYLGETLDMDENETWGGGFAIAISTGTNSIGLYFYLDGGTDASGAIGGTFNTGFPMFGARAYDLQTSYTFTIISAVFGESFVFKVDDMDPIIITPIRSLSNPDINYGYRAVTALRLLPHFDRESFGFPAIFGGKTLVLTEDLNVDKWISMPIAYTTIEGHMLPDKDSGKIIAIPLFTGIGDTYYQDLYLTNLSHSNRMAKAFETDQGTLLVVQSDLVAWKEYFDNTEIVVDMYTSWEQYPAAQLALDISNTYNA